jgi:uncharacterized protein
MTGENRKKNIQIEVERGDGSLESARILLAARQLADASSRAYYASFHYARALLLTLGEEPLSHAGVERLLHRDLVRAGKLAPEVARKFGQLQRSRLDADYAAEVVFTQEGVSADLDSATEFIEEARRILNAGEWLAKS